MDARLDLLHGLRRDLEVGSIERSCILGDAEKQCGDDVASASRFNTGAHVRSRHNGRQGSHPSYCGRDHRWNFAPGKSVRNETDSLLLGVLCSRAVPLELSGHNSIFPGFLSVACRGSVVRRKASLESSEIWDLGGRQHAGEISWIRRWFHGCGLCVRSCGELLWWAAGRNREEK